MTRLYRQSVYPSSRLRRHVPYGFQVVRDLVPLFYLAEEFRKKPLSQAARKRLAWFDHERRSGSVAATCRYFGIPRKTFYYWQKRFDPENLASLEERDRAPIRRRVREISPHQEMRIVALRRRHPRYGKEKLVYLYSREYKETISRWKIQKVIEKYGLYYEPKKIARLRRIRARAMGKKRITELERRQKTGFLLCLDAIVIYWGGMKRYIFTAIDHYSKVAFARMYTTKSSMNARDFLDRLWFLWEGQIENIQSDNGSEFQGLFRQGLAALSLEHYFSRPRTPTDNPVDERFNRTLQEEFVSLGNFSPDPEVFNRKLTEWLVEYNFRRPHQTLKYKTPIEAACGEPEVLPKYSSSTLA